MLNDYFRIAKQAASAGAELLRREFLSNARVVDASGKDIKTVADVAAQDHIQALLEPTRIPIFAEEGNIQQAEFGERVWFVDPLDGTLNFSRGFPMAAVSIALWDEGRPVIGVVHDIFNRQVYSGFVGVGSWVGDQGMHVSVVGCKEQAVLATGFPSGRNYETESLLQFVQSVQDYKKVRMLGSAALMLAQVAAGRFDAYEEEDIYLWDVAAGLALVVAAGGNFEMQPGSGPHKFNVKASNGCF